MKTKSPLFRIDRLLLAALALLAAPHAQAQLYYQTNGTNATWTSAVWNTTGSGTFNSNWVSTTNVIFSTASGGTNLVTFATATVGDITVNGNTTITAGGTVSTKSGGSTVNVADGVTLNWTNQNWSATAANQIWTKSGNGTWLIGAQGIAPSAAGSSFTLNAGTVGVSGNNSFGGALSVLNINGGTIFNSGTGNRTFANPRIVVGGDFGLSNTNTGASVVFSGGVALGSSVRTITNNATANITFSGVISNSGGLTFAGSGPGVMILSGANTYTGKSTLSSGTLRLTNTGRAGDITSDLEVAGGLLDLGAGTKTNAAFTLSGGTITNGTLQATSYALQGGTIISNATLGAGTATVTTGTTTLNGLLNAATLNVNSGTLTAGSAGRFTGAPTVTVSNGATLNLAGNEIFGSLAGAGSVSNSAGRITAGGNNSSTTFGGVLSGAGELTKTGSGTLTLSGNNTFGGVLTVAEGKLTVSSVNNASQNGVLGNSANAVVLGASGQTGFLHYVGNTNASTDKTFTAATGGTAGIEASNAATTLTLSGAIGGAGNVQKGGAGTLLLAGNNTFTGALNVHDGTLEIASINNNSANGTLGNSTNPVSLGKSGTANVSTLHYTGGTASTTKGFSMASDATAGVINVANSGTTLTVSGPITGSSGSGLTKTGIGRLSLSGSSSYNGATAVSAGDLNLSGGSITNSAVTVASGASLSGYGSVGTIGGAGAINPGNSPGILTTPQVGSSRNLL